MIEQICDGYRVCCVLQCKDLNQYPSEVGVVVKNHTVVTMIVIAL